MISKSTRVIFAAALMIGCKSDSPFGGECEDQTDCRRGERCNVNEQLCQEINSSGEGETCSVDDHCADDLVCLETLCGIDAYAPCTVATQNCGGDWRCAPQPPGFGTTSFCTLECESSDQCHGVDSFYGVAGIAQDAARCRDFPTEPPAQYCGVPCQTVDDCGGDSSSYEHRDAFFTPACNTDLGVCSWTPRE